MGVYTMKIPKEWKKIELNNIDSQVFGILTGDGDTIVSDYGIHIGKFNETVKVFTKKQLFYYTKVKMDTTGLFSSDFPEIDQSQGTFLKEFYFYEKIDGKVGKIQVAKKKIGNTGILFYKAFQDVYSLKITSKNLSDSNKKLFIEAIYTIKFKKPL
ncbi:hypothetical protein [Flavobacterium aurantiibacter]|nr:hypothetical protein [Flavobacterium aurantiibacter]